jgi:hypothetical protein
MIRLIIGLLVASAAFAQGPPARPKAPEVKEPKEVKEVKKETALRTYLDDGDGNSVEVISDDSLKGIAPVLPKGERPQLTSLNYWFLGEGWEVDKNALLKQSLVDRYLQEIAYSKAFAVLNPENPTSTGFSFQSSPPLRERANTDLTNAEIRYILQDGLSPQGDGRWEASTLNVIFLPPRLICYLGEVHSGPSFKAFLSHITTDKETLNYLVIACTGEPALIRDLAVRGILLHATSKKVD